MSEIYALDQYVEDLRRITRETDNEDEIISRVGPLAQRLAIEKDWLQQKHYEADPEHGFGVHLLHEEPDHTLAVFVVSWLPGRGAPPTTTGPGLWLPAWRGSSATSAIVASMTGAAQTTRSVSLRTAWMPPVFKQINSPLSALKSCLTSSSA